MFLYGSVLELLICWLRNSRFNLLWGELYTRENKVIPEVSKRRGGWPGFEVVVWRRLTSCWILDAMSPEIQEWSHKSRSRINNLYLLTHPIDRMHLRMTKSCSFNEDNPQFLSVSSVMQNLLQANSPGFIETLYFVPAGVLQLRRHAGRVK